MNAINAVLSNPFLRVSLPGNVRTNASVQLPATLDVHANHTAARGFQSLSTDVYFGGPGRIGQLDEFYLIDDFIILPY